MVLQTKKEYAGKRVVMLFFVAVLLLVSFLLDFTINGPEFVDLIYIVPIAAAALLLTPLETLATGIFALMLEFITESPYFNKSREDLWSLAAIASLGFVASVVTNKIQGNVKPLRMSHEALAVSPLAYAEFGLPDCRLINHNKAFLDMSPGQTGEGTLLHDYFPDGISEKLVELFDRTVTSGKREQCSELEVPAAGGKSTFW
ncbi:MAG: hypothetical protein ACYC6Z_06520 [Thermoleophilia bacterium]